MLINSIVLDNSLFLKLIWYNTDVKDITFQVCFINLHPYICTMCGHYQLHEGMFLAHWMMVLDYFNNLVTVYLGRL